MVVNITSQGKLLCYDKLSGAVILLHHAPSLFRNQSSLLAFTIPKNWRPGAGVSIVGTHVDSPNLRV